MSDILQDHLPDDAIAHSLPGTRPLAPGDWLRRDERYGEQMALRDRLIAEDRDKVIALYPEARDAADELLQIVLDELGIRDESFARPDSMVVPIDRDDPLGTLGRLCQEDFAILLKGETEHWLAGGVICFPSRWTLSEKAGRALLSIHKPVAEYDEGIAKRVQRLFDGVQVERPIVRWNHLPYSTGNLFNPATEPAVPYHPETREPNAPFIRMERQVVKRLPDTRAVIFSIHTWQVRA